MLYATLTQNRGKGSLIGKKGDLGVNWRDEKEFLKKFKLIELSFNQINGKTKNYTNIST